MKKQIFKQANFVTMNSTRHSTVLKAFLNASSTEVLATVSASDKDYTEIFENCKKRGVLYYYCDKKSLPPVHDRSGGKCLEKVI